MQNTDIVKQVNLFLAGEMLTYKQLVPHLNWAIDNINATMNTSFPIFDNDDTEYNAFPDVYIRTVVVPAAVFHFYQVDEEGMTQATQFQIDFDHGMYLMLRDYSWQVPEEYQADITNGTVDSTYQDADGQRGVTGITFDVWG